MVPSYCVLDYIVLFLQMKDFQSEHPDMGTGLRAFSQAIETVEANILWMKKNYDIVKQWLERIGTQ